MEHHHAYAIVGGKADDIAKEILDYDMPLSGHPDYFEITVDKLGISESRTLRKWAYGKPVQGDRKVAVVTVRMLTLEASNALLKIFEEPPSGTHFILCIPHVSVLIPTLRSRMSVISRTCDTRRLWKSDFHNLAREFLVGSSKTRFDIIARLNDGKGMSGFVDELEAYIAELQKPESAYEIMRVRKYLGNRGSSQKMLLDYLALTMPRL